MEIEVANVGTIGPGGMHRLLIHAHRRVSNRVQAVSECEQCPIGCRASLRGQGPARGVLSRFRTVLKAGWQGCVCLLVDGPLSRPHATVGMHGRIRPCKWSAPIRSEGRRRGRGSGSGGDPVRDPVQRTSVTYRVWRRTLLEHRGGGRGCAGILTAGNAIHPVPATCS